MSFTPIGIPDLESIVSEYYGPFSLAEAVREKPSLIFENNREEEIELLFQHIINSLYKNFSKTADFKAVYTNITAIKEKNQSQNSNQEISSNENQTATSSQIVSKKSSQKDLPVQELFFRTIFPLIVFLSFPKKELASSNESSPHSNRIEPARDEDETESKSNEDEKISVKPAQQSRTIRATLPTEVPFSEISYERTIHQLKNIGCDRLIRLVTELTNSFKPEQIEPSIQFLVSQIDSKKNNEHFDTFVQKGHLPLIKEFVKQEKVKYLGVPCKDAAKNGHLSIIKYLMELNPPKSCLGASLIAAAENGHFSIVEYFMGHERRKEIPYRDFTEASNHAIANGHTEISRYIMKQRLEKIVRSTNDAFFQAVLSLDLPFLQYIKERKKKDLSLSDLQRGIEFVSVCPLSEEINIFLQDWKAETKAENQNSNS